MDITDGKCGDESLAELEKQWGELPHTIECITGTKGRHLYFSYPSDGEIGNSAGKLGEWLDTRGEGGYVVAPPSIHPDTGFTYEWDVDHHPDETALAPAPSWILRLLTEQKSKTKSTSQPESNGTIPAGQRNCQE